MAQNNMCEVVSRVLILLVSCLVSASSTAQTSTELGGLCDVVVTGAPIGGTAECESVLEKLPAPIQCRLTRRTVTSMAASVDFTAYGESNQELKATAVWKHYLSTREQVTMITACQKFTYDGISLTRTSASTRGQDSEDAVFSERLFSGLPGSRFMSLLHVEIAGSEVASTRAGYLYIQVAKLPDLKTAKQITAVLRNRLALRRHGLHVSFSTDAWFPAGFPNFAPWFVRSVDRKAPQPAIYTCYVRGTSGIRCMQLER